MQGRHGARLNAAPKSVTHDEFISLSQLFEKNIKRAKIITVVTVTHDDIFSSGGPYASLQGRAITLSLDVHHQSAIRTSDLLRAISAAIVGDYNLSNHSTSGKKC